MYSQTLLTEGDMERGENVTAFFLQGQSNLSV